VCVERLSDVVMIVGACSIAVRAAPGAHVLPLEPRHVIAYELLLVAAAHIIALANYRPEMLPWYVLACLLVLIAWWRALALEYPDPKYLRDVMLIPTFVVLGMTFDDRRLTPVVVVIHLILPSRPPFD